MTKIDAHLEEIEASIEGMGFGLLRAAGLILRAYRRGKTLYLWLKCCECQGEFERAANKCKSQERVYCGWRCSEKGSSRRAQEAGMNGHSSMMRFKYHKGGRSL